jgi:ADP-ribosylglycohydrolase
MLGAIIGDIVGSRFEFDNVKSKDFELFHPDCRFTDDTVMTLAVAQALVRCRASGAGFKRELVLSMKELGCAYPDAGYGNRFKEWLSSEKSKPYRSFGNGSAMRASPCGHAAKSLQEAFDLSYDSAVVTHNHPDGLAGAVVIGQAVWLARSGTSKSDLRAFVEKRYDLDFTLDEIRPRYAFDETCPGSVPQALEAFCEADGFEDAIRNAVSIGGDSDTIAAMTGSLAGAFYGVPPELAAKARGFLDDRLKGILDLFWATEF